MPIQLYDLAGADPALRFSPYCWRTKLALMHKGLDFETVPWRFTDKDVLAPTGQGRVPVIIDNGKWVNDSWSIALYLDEAYPTRPRIFPDAQSRTLARLVSAWCDNTVHAGTRALATPHIFALIHDKDRAYFRESREALLGMKLEQIGTDRQAAKAGFLNAIKPAEVTLADHTFLNGAAPGYADYALLGTLLWPFTVCSEDPIDRASAVGRWFERMLGLFEGRLQGIATARSLARPPAGR